MKLDGIAGYGGLSVRGALVALLAVGLAVPLSATAPADAATVQEPGGRFRVLVVPLESSALDDDYGEDVAKEIRERLQDFATHAPVEEREFEQALKQYEIKEEDLNLIRARQLANLIGAQVVFYGTVSEDGPRRYSVEATFVDVKSGDEVSVPPMQIEDDSDEAVDRFVESAIEAFERQVRFLRARSFCADYVNSQQIERGLNNCNEALTINPNSVSALFNKALAYRFVLEQEGDDAEGAADSAIHYFQQVLEQRPGHPEALQNIAYVYSRVGAADKAASHYREYLEIDPENVNVRLKVAYDLAQAGLMAEAIGIIQSGLPYDSTNVNLLQSLGDYALRHSSDDSTYTDIALTAYERLLEVQGGETELQVLENVIAAYTRASRIEEAIAFAERALQTHTDSPRLWSLYADALARAERYSDATTAMDSVLAIDQSYRNGYLRRGRFKLEAGQVEAALEDFRAGIEAGTSSQEDVFNLFWAKGHTARNENDYEDAIRWFELSVEFVPTPERRREVAFWTGYTYFERGESLAEPENAGLSQLQRARQSFQSAATHFDQAGNVRQEVPGLKDATSKWLLNVDARIKQIQRSGRD